MSQSTQPALEYLVLDAGAIIRGHGLNLFKNTKCVVTVPEVIGEIRDSKARDLLNSIPYAIEERIPSAESMKAVVEFAKKTGDFAALSKTDLKLVALTHMLELEVYGSIEENNTKALKADFRAAKLPTNPTPAKQLSTAEVTSSVTATAVPVVAVEEESESDESDGEQAVDADSIQNATVEVTETMNVLAVSDNNKDQPTEQIENAAPTPKVFSWANIASKAPVVPLKPVQPPTKAPVVHSAAPQSNEPTAVTGESHFNDGFTEVTKVSTNHRTTSNIVSRQSGLGSSQAESSRMASEDDGLGWVNSSNLSVHLATGSGQFGVLSTDADKKKKKAKKVKRRVVKVACVTTDFSMQNVLMQVGLNIMSVDGLIIKSVKQWVLRCMACFNIHYEMDRLFCYRCGANHLSRVSASVDQDTGVLKLHLKKNYQNDTRGLQYSLPAPGKQDRYSGELLLREDQLLAGIWRQKVVKIRKDIRSSFGDDVVSDVGLHINKSQNIKVGLGQRNPNATKGRERRGKSKK